MESTNIGIPDGVLKKINFTKNGSPTSGSAIKTNMVLSFMFDKIE